MFRVQMPSWAIFAPSLSGYRISKDGPASARRQASERKSAAQAAIEQTHIAGKRALANVNRS